MSADQSAVSTAVDEQRVKLLGVLGGLQVLGMACENADRGTLELEAAVGLLTDEVQRIVTALDMVALRSRVAQPAGEEPATR